MFIAHENYEIVTIFPLIFSIFMMRVYHSLSFMPIITTFCFSLLYWLSLGHLLSHSYHSAKYANLWSFYSNVYSIFIILCFFTPLLCFFQLLPQYKHPFLHILLLLVLVFQLNLSNQYTLKYLLKKLVVYELLGSFNGVDNCFYAFYY